MAWLIKLFNKYTSCKANPYYDLSKHRVHTTKYHDLCM